MSLMNRSKAISKHLLWGFFPQWFLLNEHINKAVRWKTASLECGLCTHPPALPAHPPSVDHQEPISMEYKFTHEWKDKCLAWERERESWKEKDWGRGCCKRLRDNLIRHCFWTGSHAHKFSAHTHSQTLGAVTEGAFLTHAGDASRNNMPRSFCQVANRHER